MIEVQEIGKSLLELSLKNFRVFQEETKFKLAPITILTGANNSGKSSFIKALLLLKNNRKLGNNFSFLGGHHNLGTFESTLNSKEDDTMSFELTFDTSYHITHHSNLTNTFKCKLTYGPVISKESYLEYGFLTGFSLSIEKKKGEFHKIMELVYLEENGYRLQVEVVEFCLEMIKQNSAERLSYPFFYDDHLSHLTEQYSIFTEEFEMLASTYDIEEKQYQDFKHKLAYRAIINDLSLLHLSEPYTGNPLSILQALDMKHIGSDLDIKTLLKEIMKGPGIDEIIEEHNNIINKIGHLKILQILNGDFKWIIENVIYKKIKSLLNNLQTLLENEYIEAVRGNSKRLYSNESQGTPLNELLLKVNQAEFIEYKELSVLESNLGGGDNFIKYWLKEFEIADDYQINRIQGVASELMLLRNGKWENIADLGYGTTQLVPLILNIALIGHISYPGLITLSSRIILVEEPETNLHPKLQSKLADMLTNATTFFEGSNLTLIIETHSEYFIRKLQYLTAKKKIKPKDTALYYFYHPDKVPEGRKQVEKLEILPDGSLSDDFGTGFFDEATKWQFELLKIKNQN